MVDTLNMNNDMNDSFYKDLSRYILTLNTVQHEWQVAKNDSEIEEIKSTYYYTIGVLTYRLSSYPTDLIDKAVEKIKNDVGNEQEYWESIVKGRMKDSGVWDQDGNNINPYIFQYDTLNHMEMVTGTTKFLPLDVPEYYEDMEKWEQAIRDMVLGKQPNSPIQVQLKARPGFFLPMVNNFLRAHILPLLSVENEDNEFSTFTNDTKYTIEDEHVERLAYLASYITELSEPQEDKEPEYEFKVETPAQMGLYRKITLEPENGWYEHSYYLIDVAYSSHNVIHQSILYTGFLDKDGHLRDNSQIFNGNSEGLNEVSDTFYIKAVKFLHENV